MKVGSRLLFQNLNTFWGNAKFLVFILDTQLCVLCFKSPDHDEFDIMTFANYRYSQTVWLGYGLTETTGAVTRTKEDSPPGTVGEILPFLELKVDCLD